MALSNIYKPQNKFSHLGSDDDFDDDDDELDDDLDDSYSKNFTAFHSPSRTAHNKPLLQPDRKTKIRRVRARPWCTTKSCIMCFLWVAFFSVCVVGLVLIILKAVSSMDAAKDSKSLSVKKVLHEQEQFSDDDDDLIDACDTFHAEKIWHSTLPKLMTETAVRLNDVNEDGVKDMILSFSTGVDGYNAPRLSCDLYFNGTFPCFGGALALDGVNGKELWRHYTKHEVFALNCDGDLDLDGVWDCLIAGRAGVFQAVSGKSGKLLWNFGSQEAREPIMNVYTAQFIRDLNGDGVMEVLAAHGGDPLA